MVEVEVFINQE